jgi:hypothetical protein
VLRGGVGEHRLAEATLDPEVLELREQPVAEFLGEPAPSEPRIGEGATGLHDARTDPHRSPVRHDLARVGDRDLTDAVLGSELRGDPLRVVEGRVGVGPSVGPVDPLGEPVRIDRRERAHDVVLLTERGLLVEHLHLAVLDDRVVLGQGEPDVHHVAVGVVLSVDP